LTKGTSKKSQRRISEKYVVAAALLPTDASSRSCGDVLQRVAVLSVELQHTATHHLNTGKGRQQMPALDPVNTKT